MLDNIISWHFICLDPGPVFICGAFFEVWIGFLSESKRFQFERSEIRLKRFFHFVLYYISIYIYIYTYIMNNRWFWETGTDWVQRSARFTWALRRWRAGCRGRPTVWSRQTIRPRVWLGLMCEKMVRGFLSSIFKVWLKKNV